MSKAIIDQLPELRFLIKEYGLTPGAFEIELLLDNQNRKEIYELIKTKRLNIKEISKAVKVSYKNTFFHIKKLEQYGLVKRESPEKGSHGGKVYVVPTEKNYVQVKKEFEEKLKEKFKKDLRALLK